MYYGTGIIITRCYNNVHVLPIYYAVAIWYDNLV